MANIDQMQEHYAKAGQYYEQANKCPSGSEYQRHWQKMGDAEYKKACDAYEKEKADIQKEASAKYQEIGSKLNEACDKGDVKAIKQYQAEADKVESEMKSKIRDLDNKNLELHNEVGKKVEGLQRIQY